MVMDWFLVATTFDVIGKVMIGVSVLFVHRRIVREKKIDKSVLREIRSERWFTILGIILIAVGYLIHLLTSTA